MQITDVRIRKVETAGKLKAVASAPTKAAIIVVPDDYYNWAGVPRV